jgi:hypothetical protein
MFWSLSLQFLPGEKVIEDSSKQTPAGVKPAYSVFLTNKRVVFRFDGFGSTMAQSFTYDEIATAHAVKRMLITYLGLTTRTKEHFLHVPQPEYWALKILDTKTRLQLSPAAPPTEAASSGDLAGERKRRELHAMLATLRNYHVITDADVQDKARIINTIVF